MPVSSTSNRMAGTKRRYPAKTGRPSKFRRTGPRLNARSINKLLQATVNRNLETKQSLVTSTDNQIVTHNSIQFIIGGNLLATTQGVTDPANTATANRIGDKLTLQKVVMKMMIELDERCFDTTFRVMVVRAARGDVPSTATLFKNQSANKMLDEFDSERYTLVAHKWAKLTSRNISATATTDPAYPGGFLGPLNTAANVQYNLTRATKLVTLSILGSKFSKNGIIQYESATSNVKFFDYYVLLYGYSNYLGVSSTTQVARVNDFISRMYFKDG